MAESKPVVSKVEMPLKRGVIRIEDGETSQGHDKRVIPIDQEAQKQSGSSREERIKMFKEENGVRISKTPKIQKVIFLLRDHKEFVKYYEPRVVSLGPIHHGNEKYQLAETFKRKLAKVFVDSSGKTIEEICKAVDGKIKELRECFEEEVTKKYNDVDLAWILVIDGCAILQYIDLAINDKFKDFGIKNDSVAFCQQDLFLLENQVPYRLLELLMSSSPKPVEDALRKSVEKFIKRNHHMVLMDKSPDSESGKHPTHLLDLLRSSLLGNAKENGKTEGNLPTNQEARVRSSDSQSCRTVQEIKAAGIHVKRSKANSLRNISFSRKLNRLLGVLSLPPLIVDDSTGPKLLNLIAHEMCLDFDNDFGISSYVSFLDSLIDQANDVKELRKAHVLFNFLGSDEEVAKLFNEIGTDLVPDLDEYKHVRTQIQEYYNKKWGKWLGEFVHNHFSSPWTVLAFLGALLALALSATQTWYAVDSPPGPCDKFCDKFNQNL
ncbi:UPF0481 protein At3g47200-like [Carya illinoinensis]|uniref:Uncharacterized protein n=1 Tax=Carya illinoinensis TaxID=32201 RepID=A0A8T1P9T1_CARIL|nr:UPF0481 protein At3g47200-like [Carya illinoinensis]KAG6638491.1 hypothetical protein CIPAW_10G038300 [Carya illinoinensis]